MKSTNKLGIFLKVEVITSIKNVLLRTTCNDSTPLSTRVDLFCEVKRSTNQTKRFTSRDRLLDENGWNSTSTNLRWSFQDAHITNTSTTV